MKTITYDIERNLERSHRWFDGRRKLLEFLSSSLCIQEDFLVADIGCGVGSNLKLLKSMCLTLIGVDSETYSLSLAKQNCSSISLANGDLMRPPFRANSVEVIIASLIFKHLDKEGKVIFTTPHLSSYVKY